MTTISLVGTGQDPHLISVPTKVKWQPGERFTISAGSFPLGAPNRAQDVQPMVIPNLVSSRELIAFLGTAPMTAAHVRKLRAKYPPKPASEDPATNEFQEYGG